MKESKSQQPDNIIYCLKNKINGKMYIGKTSNLKRRWLEHKNRNKLVIQKAINKYGAENFEKIIIEDNLTNEEVYEKEKYWIKYFDTYNGVGYNSSPGGKGMPSGEECPLSGVKRPEQSKRMSGKNNPMYGVERPDTRKRLLEDNPIYKVDTSGKNHWNYGKKTPKETRLKMSFAHKGKHKGSKNAMYGVKGKEHPRNKLTKEEGMKIYKEYHNTDETLISLANKHPVGKSTISKIKNCNHWTTKHLKQAR